MRLGVACLLGGIPLVALLAVGAGLSQPSKDVVMIGCLVAVFVLGASGLRAFARSNEAILAERDAGYTTLYGMFIHLWQLDHRTGEVLRRPGERKVRRQPKEES